MGDIRGGGDVVATCCQTTNEKLGSVFNLLILLVEPGGIEPPTSSMPLPR